MVWTIHYHPDCSKSRDCLALLRHHGIEPEVIDYQRTPLDRAALMQLQQRLGCPIHALLRPDGDADDSQLSEADVLDRLVAQPGRLQRPIVSNGERAVIARPPERALSLF